MPRLSLWAAPPTRQRFGLVGALLAALLLVGCSDPTVQGDAFVLNGAGAVMPAAGRQVWLLPYDSEAEFFRQLKVRAIESAGRDLAPQFTAACATAYAVTRDIERDLLAKRQSLRNLDSAGCASVSAADEALERDHGRLASVHEQRMRELRERLGAQERALQTRLDARARQLLEAQLARVRLRVLDQEHFTVRLELSNPTEACVQVRYQLLANRTPVMDVTEAEADSEDEYGFSHGCGVMPGRTLSFADNRLIGSSLEENEAKLARARGIHDFETMAGVTFYPKITSVRVVSAVFAQSREQTGGSPTRRVYKPLPIDWKALALQSPDLREAEQGVRRLRDELERIEREFRAHPAVVNWQARVERQRACRADQSAQATSEEQLVRLRGAALSLQQCTAAAPDRAALVGAFELINGLFAAKVAVPPLDRAIGEAFQDRMRQALEDPATLRSETSIAGAFQFPRVPRGRYLIVSSFENAVSEVFWLNEIEVRQSMRADLNPGSLVKMPLLDYARAQFDAVCSDCPAGQAVLRPRAEVLSAHESIRRRMRDTLDALSDSIERLRRLRRN